VEHTTNTVIALGPGYNLMKGDLYEDLLGVSCHELFHAWNIKTIRPVEMQPYDYTKENYSKLGYVCEGVTTYYGDYLLYRSKVYNDEQYWRSFEERMQKHFDNFGRYNLSVADSSFDTWLDGYNPGIPNRKTSIYDEGCLLAFATDIFIRKNSNNKYSLDDVMLYLYNEFGLKGKGYSDKDYKGVVEHFANTSFDNLFNNYFNSAADYSVILAEALNYIGCSLQFNSNLFYQHALGLKVQEVAGLTKVMSVYPDSVADLAGIAVNDDIISINNMVLRPDSTGTNFSEWCTFFGNVPLKLTINSNYKTKEVNLLPNPNSYYKTAKVVKLNDASETKRENYELWSKNKF
jgi:predicted metalloprotease with PDZ domain